jgi:SOS-response transcriptional repressor LexA
MVTDQAVLAFIISQVETYGYPPTTRELCKHFHWSSTNSPRDHLKRLERDGFIRCRSALSRGIQVLGVRWEMVLLTLAITLAMTACGGAIDVPSDAGSACVPGSEVQQAPNVKRVCDDAGAWQWEGTATATN